VRKPLGLKCVLDAWYPISLREERRVEIEGGFVRKVAAAASVV
jgi:hypothetical protein